MRNDAASYVDGAIEIQCEHCGKFVVTERQTAFFCSGKCRVAAFRAKKNRKKLVNDTIETVKRLIGNLPPRGDSDEFTALQEIETLCKIAIRGVES